jgi:glycosyltransferase involved in cell wall biosynthesis
MLIPETLFRYRTAIESRYIADKDTHWRTIKDIRNLHPGHKKIIRMLLKKNGNIKHLVNPKTAFINTCGSDMYKKNNNSKVNVLIAIPWMTFGGAETLIVNFCNEIKDKFNLSFVTGLASSHEWEYKFIEITENVYHLNNLFKDDKLYIEFISNYITTRDINVLHIIHTSFVFEMLPELKKRHPNLKVIVTVFNDRAEHFENSVMMEEYIDTFTTDNSKVANLYRQKILKSKTVTVIPNGINSLNVFTPAVVDRQTERNQLGIKTNELAVFFIGRLSEEKNPDVFLKVANKIISNRKENNIKFFIIGDGVMRPEIEKTISDINSPNIKYLGYQSEVARYLSAADIFVLPSSVEGFPLSILEAMAMKVAVISSDVGAVSEVLEKDVDGFIVTPGSVNEIKDAILYLNNDRKQLDIFKQKSRRKVEAKYSNTILGQNYVKLYRDTLK